MEVLISALVVGAAALWMQLDPAGLHVMATEDGPIESAGAILFGIACVGFLVAAWRCDYLRHKPQGLRYPMILAWALLMFVFMGEEISWGQRIFGFDTPEALMEVNHQNEVNLHNIEFVDRFMGGKYRYLSFMMLMTGLGFPLLALIPRLRRWMQWWAFPVAPLGYAVLFTGAYWYGKHFFSIGLHLNDADEMREFLMACAMACFALHGAIRPCALFRVCDEAGMDSPRR
jgi:hypothetical protein